MAIFTETKFKEVNQSGNHIIFSKCNNAEVSIEKSGYSIKVPLVGEEHYAIDNKNYTIGPNEFLLVNKNQRLTGKVESPYNVISNCIYLDNRLVEQTFYDVINQNLFLDYNESSEFNFFHGSYKFEKNALSFLLNELRNSNYENITEEWYYEVTFELLKLQVGINQLMNKLNITKPATKQELHERLNVAKSYIIDNYSEDLTIENISLNSCISKFHLIRTFKEVFGETPYNYLTSIRLKKALELIRATKFTLEEIAFKTGFKDRQNLSRNFKKQFGYTPSDLIIA